MSVKLVSGRGDFTSYGGLYIAEQIMKGLDLRSHVIEHLPHQDRKFMRNRDYSRFLSFINGFIVGADCLDDFDSLFKDPGFQVFSKDRVWAAETLGYFLRQFKPYQARNLNEKLRDFALKARKRTTSDPNLIIDIDSTFHEQYAKKMEGLEFNYESKWGLSSLEAFDQYGFQYWSEVRNGASFTSNGAPGAIRHIFSHIPRKMRRFLRADSGYCNFDVMRACLDLNVDFVIAMRGPMYDAYKRKVRNWKNPKKPIKFRDGRLCEVGSTLYHAKGIGRLLRAVFIRSKKKDPDIYDRDPYDYRAFVTTIGEHEMKSEGIVDFYRKRGNAENFIKEIKNGYDLHHFPCQRLLCNKVYGIMAAYAHNVMRCMGRILDPKQVPYHKRIRFRMIYLAGQVVRKARNVIIRVNDSIHKEVNRWLTSTYITAGSG